MDCFKGLEFEVIKEDDIEKLTQIMKRAFDEDTKIHLNEPHGGPDGYDNGDFLRKYALDSKSDAYKIAKNGRLIGAAIVWINEDHINYLGNIFIDPQFQNNGTGTLIWNFIEKRYSETKVWRTDTPGYSKRNHNFYINKCGFKVIKILNPFSKYEESYIMEKIMFKQE
ncbi:GNAT family N-acetyltransferase [Sporolactobacillus laevolacticus]|uniref:GNAT family N-acetyltransferase n=1 Tax=Sporolactobacillus laevolacticus TaxID=33018 RepID=UPI0025B480D1|nr:GNAT family N-acetyltransferase [Sporolactobacillus laevolacticus]MDN3956025.1 GNAT family N-acetyltransferase [Sporolactobacillus laevolacticus]